MNLVLDFQGQIFIYYMVILQLFSNKNNSHLAKLFSKFVVSFNGLELSQKGRVLLW